jgi:hypothetical protein
MSALLACGPNGGSDKDYITPWKLSGAETVIVSVKDDKSKLNFLRPMSGRGGGALSGAGSAVAGALEMGTGCEGIGCAIVLPIALGAGVVGGAVGAANSRSEQETEDAVAKLVAEIRAAEPSKYVEAYLLGSGPVQPNGPRVRKGMAGATTLKLTITMRFGFGGNRFNPDVVTSLQAIGTLRNGRSATPVTVTWQYLSDPHSYFALAENDAKLMSEVIEAGSAELAKLIRSELSRATGAAPSPNETP